MKKTEKRKGSNFWKKYGAAGAVCLVLLAAVISLLFSRNEGPSILKDLRAKNGYIRTVESEEYEFFRKLVARDAVEDLTEEELKLKVEEKINRTNAEFLLGNQMGVCAPYSFESFQLDMERENSQRKLKKEKGEIFYGPVEFTLTAYYEYVSGNVKLDMVQFITANADREVQEGAKAYFQENKEKYRTIETVTYRLKENGKEEEKVVLYEDFSTLEKTDSELFEFLYNGKKGDVLNYAKQENSREVEILSVEYEKLTYKNNAERVMRDYITNVYLENWLQEIEENYPVEINF